ncbi:lamin tail domain-containing protein [Streptomyces sp. NPDC087903]|uniref:lamin tail domain-containing protein n=1 Tax=Streptomyces sp. NPDC087903 TaxID=3365819 RepID=UPI0037FAC527
MPAPCKGTAADSGSATAPTRTPAARAAAARRRAVTEAETDTEDHARPHRPAVEISDVQYDSPAFGDRSNRSLNKEWVEVTNTGRRAVNLDGWTLSDEDGHTYTFQDRFWLEGRSSVRIHTGVGRDTDTDMYQDRRNYVWDNRSDTPTLRRRDRFVDAVSWGHDRRHGGNRH